MRLVTHVLTPGTALSTNVWNIFNCILALLVGIWLAFLVAHAVEHPRVGVRGARRRVGSVHQLVHEARVCCKGRLRVQQGQKKNQLTGKLPRMSLRQQKRVKGAEALGGQKRSCRNGCPHRTQSFSTLNRNDRKKIII